MKFVTFKSHEKTEVGIILHDENVVTSLSNIKGFEACNSMIDLIEKIGVNGTSALENLLKNTDDLIKYNMSDIVLLSPITRPIHDVICVGVNYSDHFEECQSAMPMEKPKHAVYFSKRSNRILSATEDIPHTKAVDFALDYEVELAVIIGKEGVNIKEEDAEKYIFGYSVFNDLSARTLQKNHQQWYKGKGLDNTSVMGPFIVSADQISYPPMLDISCVVNGEIRQNSNTKMFINNISKMIADISAGCTLEAGDILITGTPAGVGMGFNPPRYLEVGDVVECIIENVGSHKNKII